MKSARKFLIAALGVVALVFLSLPQTAHADWTNDPWSGMVTVTNQPGADEYPKIMRLGSGYLFIAWIHNDGGGLGGLRYQILDDLGNPLLGTAGNPLLPGATWSYGWGGPTLDGLIPDGQGGCIAVVIDNRNGLWDIYGQRFDSYGQPLWGPTGMPLAEWPGLQDITLYDVTANSNGDVFFSWNVQDSTGHTDLYVQKVNSSGSRLWGTFGVPAGTGPGSQAYSAVVPDASGGALIVWEDSRANPYTYYLYAQHLDANGNPLLAVNGVPVLNQGSQMAVGSLDEGVPDGRGGGIWVYTTPGWDNHLDVVRINGQGQLLWLWFSPYYAYHYIYDVKRHTISNTLWISAGDDRPGAPGLYLYQFDVSGHALFGSGGLPYGGDSMSQTSDGMIVFSAYPAGQGTRFYALRVNSRGRVPWVTNVALSTQQGVFDNPVGTSDGADGAVVAFEDRRQYPTTQIDISAQRVQRNGQLGNPGGPENPVLASELSLAIGGNGQVQFVLSQAGQIRLELYDLLGRRVAVLRDGFEPAGTFVTRLDHLSLPAGVYIYRLEAGQSTRSGKIMLLK